MIRTRTWTRVLGGSSGQGSVRESSDEKPLDLGPNEVLVQVEHSAVGLHEWYKGKSPTSCRSCGYVRAVGTHVTSVVQGDSVVVLRANVVASPMPRPVDAGVAFAPTSSDETKESVCMLVDILIVTEDDVRLVPLNLSARELVLLIRPGLAALDVVHNKMRILPGQSVLICGASSPMAHLAIQLVLAKGGSVLAVVASKEEAAALSNLELVSCTVVDTSSCSADQLSLTLTKATEGLGFEHILQCASPGSTNWTHDIPALISAHGCWVFAPSYSSSRSPEVLELGPSAAELLRKKNANLCFVNLDIWSTTATQRGMLSWLMDSLMEFAVSGLLRNAPAVEMNVDVLNSNLQRGGLTPRAPMRLQMLVSFPHA